MKEAKYAERQRAKGFTLVKVWVPEEQVENLKAYALSLRETIEEDKTMLCGPEKTVEILDELLTLGFTDTQFRSMHHLGTSLEKHSDYCKGRTKFQEGSKNELLCKELEVELVGLRKKQ